MPHRYVPTLNTEYFDAIERCAKNAKRWEQEGAPFLAEWLAKFPTRRDARDAAYRYIATATTDDDPMIEKLRYILPAILA